jgi:hypothetical protein
MVIGSLGVKQVVGESPGGAWEVLWWLLGHGGVGARLGGAYLLVSGDMGWFSAYGHQVA